jgi:Domain of unknown function (DUF4157)
MFAQRLAKPSAKTAADSNAKSPLLRAMPFGNRRGDGSLDHLDILQRTIGNQGTLRLLQQGRLNLLKNEGGDPEQQPGPASMKRGGEAPRIAWDFSKIQIYGLERMGRFRPPPPFRAARIPGFIQAKLKVGDVNDPLEYEADRVAEQVTRMPAAEVALTSERSQINRKCDACEDEEEKLQRKPARTAEVVASESPDIVHDVLQSPGHHLDKSTRDFFEPRFGHDFSHVRVHVDAEAGASARSIGALAYTKGFSIVFGPGQYSPQSEDGRRLLAHELAHVVQQGTGRSAAAIRRACLSGPACVSPSGSASVFGTTVGSLEAAKRARRAAMSPTRARAHGHTGHARALETFLHSQVPGLLGEIHGIFIDQDMDESVAAGTQDCASMVPPITGATKPCVFVHGSMNQEALKFNTDAAAATIGGGPREDWRIATVQTLVHEIQHVLYGTAFTGAAVPGGVTSCARADVEFELSELNAIMSEFPSVFDAVPVGAAATDPAAVRLKNWFTFKITNSGESIRGILTIIRCKCSCPDSDAFVQETFNFVTNAWTTAQKDAFNAELRRPAWGISWPL